MNSWDQVREWLAERIQRFETFSLSDLVPKVRHLKVPWNDEQHLKQYLRYLAKDVGARLDVRVAFDGRGNSIYLTNEENYVYLIHRTQAQLRGLGKRLALLTHGLSEITRRRRKKLKGEGDHNQLRFNFIEYKISDARREPVANLVPFSAPDHSAKLRKIVVDVFTSAGDEIPSFSKVMAGVVQRTWGITVPEFIFDEKVLPQTELRQFYEKLVALVKDASDALARDMSTENSADAAE